MTATAGRSVYGLLAVHGVDVALPLDVLREVIPAPAAYRPVPMAAPGLLGTIVLRGLIIPVLDVAGRMGAPPRDAGDEDPVVAIVVQDDRILGLLADGVRGVVEVADGDLQHLAVNGDVRPLFRACFARPGTDTVVSVLDGDAIFSLPGIPVASRAGWSAGVDLGVAVTATGGDATAATVMLFEVGRALFGLDVTDVSTVLPEARPEPSVLDGPTCRGVTAFGARHVPVVDLLALTGFGRLPAAEVRQGVVLAMPRGFVALALTDMHAVTRVRADELRPVPALGIAEAERFRGLYTADDGRHYLVLDAARLLRDPELDALSALNTSTAGADDEPAGEAADAAEAAGGAGRAGGTYLTYDVGTTIATPFDEVAEIMAYPDDLVVSTSARPEVLATFVHRGVATPLVDLAALLRPARPRAVTADARVLLVHGAAGPVAFAVAELHAIERSVWEADAEGDPPRTPAELLASAPLLEVVTDGQQRLLPRVSLLEVVRHLAPRPLAVAGPADLLDAGLLDAGLLDGDGRDPSAT